MPRRAASSELDELRVEIRARKLRATPARLEVLELLRRVRSPLTHLEVCARLAGRTHDRATIYRALNQLAAAGLLRRVDLGDRMWRFDVADPTTPQRADFVCVSCGSVIPVTGIKISATDAPLAVGHRQVEVRLLGRCDRCQEVPSITRS